MPFSSLMTTSTPASPQEVDAQCRGIGARPVAARGHAPGTGLTALSSVPAEAPVGRTAARGAVRLALREAVTHEAHERFADLMRLGGARSSAMSGEPFAGASPELLRRFELVRSAAGRYACERRDEGAPAERVAHEMRRLVQEAAHAGWIDRADTLTAQVVRWTIAAYHDSPNLAHVPRCD